MLLFERVFVVSAVLPSDDENSTWLGFCRLLIMVAPSGEHCIMTGHINVVRICGINGNNSTMKCYILQYVQYLLCITYTIKFYEKIYNRLVDSLEENAILYKHQYGFRSKESTQPVRQFADANGKHTK